MSDQGKPIPVWCLAVIVVLSGIILCILFAGGYLWVRLIERHDQPCPYRSGRRNDYKLIGRDIERNTEGETLFTSSHFVREASDSQDHAVLGPIRLLADAKRSLSRAVAYDAPVAPCTTYRKPDIRRWCRRLTCDEGVWGQQDTQLGQWLERRETSSPSSADSPWPRVAVVPKPAEHGNRCLDGSPTDRSPSLEIDPCSGTKISLERAPTLQRPGRARKAHEKYPLNKSTIPYGDTLLDLSLNDILRRTEQRLGDYRQFIPTVGFQAHVAENSKTVTITPEIASKRIMPVQNTDEEQTTLQPFSAAPEALEKSGRSLIPCGGVPFAIPMDRGIPRQRQGGRDWGSPFICYKLGCEPAGTEGEPALALACKEVRPTSCFLPQVVDCSTSLSKETVTGVQLNGDQESDAAYRRRTWAFGLASSSLDGNDSERNFSVSIIAAQNKSRELFIPDVVSMPTSDNHTSIIYGATSTKHNSTLLPPQAMAIGSIRRRNSGDKEPLPAFGGVSALNPISLPDGDFRLPEAQLAMATRSKTNSTLPLITRHSFASVSTTNSSYQDDFELEQRFAAILHRQSTHTSQELKHKSTYPVENLNGET